MNKASLYRLTTDFRMRAEHFFGVDFSSVRFDVCSLPKQVNTLAFALNDAIYLSPELFFQKSINVEEIIAHELTHIAQYQCGLNSGTITRNIDHPEKYDRLLEQQASMLGHAFSNGIPRHQYEILPKYKNSSSLQTYVVLNGEVVESVNSLSDSAIQVLEFIKYGEEWFEWAVQQQSRGFYFGNEAQMLDAIQYGLHGNKLLFISQPELIINPAKLINLSTDDIGLLKKDVIPDEENTVVDLSVSKMLAKNGLRVKSDLDVGLEFLNQVGVSGDTLFQAMSLNDLIMLFEMINEANTSTSLNTLIQKEAADFSIANAQSIDEFIDLYEFYISLSEKLDNKSSTPKKRALLADQHFSDISASLYDATQCPVIDQGLSLAEICSLVQKWIGGGRVVGFNKISRGVSQVMKGTSIGQAGASVDTIEETNKYISDAQTLIKSTVPESSFLSQDGLTTFYTVVSGAATAVMALNTGGELTLSKYHPGR